MSHLVYFVATLVFDIAFSILGSIVVASAAASFQRPKLAACRPQTSTTFIDRLPG